MEHQDSRSAMRWVPRRHACAAALLVVVTTGVGCGVAEMDPSLEAAHDERVASTRQEVTAWDSVAKPAPTKFLFAKRGADCANGPCDDANGLVTAAGISQANQYYIDIGEASLDTLPKWLANYGFPKRNANEDILAYRSRTGVVIYYNKYELGLGRELACSSVPIGTTGIKLGCYVTNYGTNFNDNTVQNGMWRSLDNAINGVNLKNTVVISYDSTRPADFRVQFAAYGETGKRLDKAQLDYVGSRSIPGVCVKCHGGTFESTGGKRMAKKAHFLPLHPDMVDWAPSGNTFSKNNMLERVRKLNDLAFSGPAGITESVTTSFKAAVLNPLQRQYLTSIYNIGTDDELTGLKGRLNGYLPGLATATVNPVTQQETWNTDEAGSTTSATANANRAFFNEVLNPYCGTCHWALADTATAPPSGTTSCNTLCHGVGGSEHVGEPSYLLAKAYAFKHGKDTPANSAHRHIISRSLGIDNYGVAFGAAMTVAADFSTDTLPLQLPKHSMPHAQPAYARFWGEPRGGFNSGALYWSAFAGGNGTSAPSFPSAVQCSSNASCGLTTGSGGTRSGRMCSSARRCEDISTSAGGTHCPGSEKLSGASTGGTAGTANYFFRANMSGVREAKIGNTCQQCGMIGYQPCPTSPGPACHQGDLVSGLCTARDLSLPLPAAAILATGTPVTGALTNLTDASTATFLQIGPSSGSVKVRVDLGQGTPGQAPNKVLRKIRFTFRTTCPARMTNALVRLHDTDNELVHEQTITGSPTGAFEHFFHGPTDGLPIARFITIEATQNANCGGLNGKVFQLDGLQVTGWDAPCRDACSYLDPSLTAGGSCCICNGTPGTYVQSAFSPQIFQCQQ